jgi:hypothetical protein
MRLKYTFVFLFLIISATVNAQNVLKGSVFENATNNKLPNVFVRDNTSKQVTITDNNGNFQVRTETGHTLIFESPGYISDTLYVIDLTPKKIMLEPKTIALREVSISASRQAFDPKKEYPDVYQKSKVYVLSPSSWFGKENRDARRLKRYFRTEAEERHVDAVFTRAYVGSIVPLKGKDLEDFMTLYRPSYAFLRSNNSESLVAYINDSYKKFQTLPPEKRSLQRLTN